MHEHNHCYGQAQILAVYATNARCWSAPSIPGHLQHDWDLTTACSGDRQLNASLTAYLWSLASRERRQRTNLRNHVIIGAPWLYLLALDPVLLELPLTVTEQLTQASQPQSVATPTTPEGLLFFPTHDVDGEHAARRLATQVRELQSGPVTVALSNQDFQVPAIRRTYAAADFAQHNLGAIADDSGSPAPRYLSRLLTALRAHCQVAANATRCELLYAASLEKPVHVIDETTPWSRPLTDPKTATIFADAELGREFVLSPPKLRDVLEWSNRD